MKGITLLCLCVIVLAAGTGAGAWIYHNTSEEQVSIQEEEIVCKDKYKIGAFLSVWKIHDNKDNVTCWIHGSGIYCIPDHMLTP